MPGYANALARYFSSLFGGGQNSSQKLQKNNETGGSTTSVRKRNSANRSGSSFATASQGDAAYYMEEGSATSQRPHKKKQTMSRSQSQADKETPVPPPPRANVIASTNQGEQRIDVSFLGTDLKPDDCRLCLKNKLDHRQFVDLAVFGGYDLRYVKFLGSGGQGEVHHVQDVASKQQFALKIIKQNSAAKKYEKEALEVIREHQYPGIIHLECAIEDEDFLFLLTQFVEGLTVRDIIPYMEQFPWERKREFVIPLLAELCLAVDYLHGLGYVHRDIKASNCFLDMFGHVTIGDFGSCIQRNLIKARVIFGTVPYTISPEMFCKVPYGVEADYWGIGVLACELLLGFFPFDWFTRDEIKSKETVNDVIQTIKCPQIPADVPEDIQQVLFAFLAADPRRRLGSPALGGIESVERHPFFAGIHWDRFRNPAYRRHSLPVLKLMKAIQRKRAAKEAQAAAAAAAAEKTAIPLANQLPANHMIPIAKPESTNQAGVANVPLNMQRPANHQSGGDIG